MNLVIISALFFVLPVYELVYSAIADLGGIRNRLFIASPYIHGWQCNAKNKQTVGVEWIFCKYFSEFTIS